MANRNQVTKIYELKTLGYDEVIRQLTSVEAKFKSITELKKKLNEQKISTSDADALIKINEELTKAEVRTKELRLQKIQLTNESKALQNATLAETNALKAKTSAIQAQSGSYNDLLRQQKELYAILKNTAPGNSLTFQGQILSFDQAILKYRELAAAEQAFRRQFQADAVLIGEYTRGIVNAFRQLGLGDLIGAQAEKAAARLRALDSEFERLKSELVSLRAAGKPFDEIEAKLIANRNEAAQLNSQLQILRTSLNNTGNIGNQITTGLANGFNSLKNNIRQFLVIYLGFYAAFNQIRKAVHVNAELSDSFADLQIRIKGSEEDVQKLFEQLKKLDTRTSLTALVDISNIVAKKGVAKEEIVGITQALDQLFVLLGKEIGQPEEATASIVKLISIFNKDGKVTADRVREIGTEMFKLTTNGVATGAFLIDFAERVGAVRGITGLTLPNILGLGAALEQLGQKREVAGTAAIQLVTKIFSDVEKFSKAAKLSVEDFRKLLEKNPFEALVAVAQGLSDLSDTQIAENFEEIVKAFDEVQVRGVRIKAVLGEIATNGKLVQEKMDLAKVSTSDYATALEGSRLKQETFAASLDRIKKQFEVLATSTAVRTTFALIAAAISGLIGIIPTLLTLLGLLAVAWTVQNAQMLLLRGQVILYNLAIGALYITQGALYILQGLYIVGMYALQAAMFVATNAVRLFNIALLATPLGWILAAVAAIASIYTAFGQKLDGATDKTKKLTQAQKDSIRQLEIEREIRAKATEAIGEHIAKLEELVRVVLSEKVSYDTSRAALQKLIEMHAEFSGALKGNAIDAEALKKILGEVKDQIQINANAEAASKLSAQYYQDYIKVVSLRQRIEAFLVNPSQKAFRELFNKLTQEEKDLAFTQRSEAGLSDASYSADLNAIKAEEAKRLKDYEDYATASANAQAKLIGIQKKVEDKRKQLETLSVEQQRLFALKNPQSIEELTALIQGIDKERDKLKEGDPKLVELARLRDIFQARLDALNNKKLKTEKYYGARLTGEDKDALAEIEARTRTELSIEERRYAGLLLLVRQYHDATYADEIEYTTNIKNIQEKGLKEKIAYLESKDKLNAKEKEQLAKFREDLAKTELKYVQDIDKINEREFNKQETKLKKQLDAQIAIIEENQQRLEADPNVSEEAKARAQQEAHEQILKATKAYYLQLLALAEKYGVSDLNLEEKIQKALSDLKKKGLKDELEITEAIYKDIERAGEKHVEQVKATYALKVQAILESNKAFYQKQKEIEGLDRQQQLLLDTVAVATAKIRLEQAKVDYAKGKITAEELAKATTNLANALRKLAQDAENVPSAIENIEQGFDGLAKTLGRFVKLPAEQGQLLKEGILATFKIAETALNNFFEREYRLIQRSLDINKKRLDIEKQQRLDRAQSRAEELSIQKQYDEKQHELEKVAFERNKRLQISQLSINYAVQLSNIALAAAQNPTNAYTYGAAGVAQYAVQAALATALYLLNLSNISSQQFAQGGTLGGPVGGKKHSQGGNKFLFHGRVYEDEVGEMNIVRMQNVNPGIVYTLQGTHTQIASALNVLGGGREFAPGGKRFEAGGVLGTRYTAPTYIPSSTGPGNYELMRVITDLANEQSARIDRLEVYQVTSTVTDAQKKQVKQNSIGSF